MGKAKEPIQVKAFVTVDGVRTDVDTLNEEQKRKLATWLKKTYLNELFRGVAVFYETESEKSEGTDCHAIVRDGSQ